MATNPRIERLTREALGAPDPIAPPKGMLKAIVWILLAASAAGAVAATVSL